METSHVEGATASEHYHGQSQCSISSKHLRAEYSITQKAYLQEEINLQITGGVSKSWKLLKKYREKLAEVFS